MSAERFCEALRRVAGEAHGPLPPGEAVGVLLQRLHELGGERGVALPSADDVLARYGVAGAVEAAKLPVVAPARAAVGVTGVVAASAETGTVAVACGPGSPRSVSLVPDAHLALLPLSLLDPDLETAMARALSAPTLPSALTWVSGPSRTADIEKRIVVGMHGPRTMEVVLVDDDGGRG